MSIIRFCAIVAFVALVGATPTPKTETKQTSTEYLEIKRNDYQSNAIEGRSFEENIEEYIKGHDVTLRLPIVDTTVTFGARNLDNGEIDVKVNYNTGREVEARKKSKVKKILVPIFIFLLIKAIVLIPLALGVLAIKTWNALQLSFGSFVIAISLAVWQLCKKIMGDNAHPQIIAHDPWPAAQQYAARAFGEEAQKMAYSAYQQ